MLRDVDSSLSAWLADYLPPGVGIVFDAPTGRADAEPALGLYLHDVREEAEITPGDWTGIRDDDGRMVGRLPPQRRYRLTYLITAWAASPLDEHELLGNVLAGCALHHAIPADALRGCLVDLGQAVMIRCAPFDRICDPRELWAAWRIPPRTALELSVLAPLPVTLLTNLPRPPREVALSSTRPPGGASVFDDRQPGMPGRGRARIDE